MKTGLIYLITNTVNGKTYVGQTRQELSTRWTQHVSAANCGSEKALHRAIRKYGVDAFEMKILCEALLSEMSDMEIAKVSEYESFGPRGYNMTAGGDGARDVVVSIETRLKLSASVTGLKRTPEQNERRSIATLGEGNGFFGKTHTEDVRAKISLVHKGKPKSPETIAKMKEARSRRPRGIYSPSPETRAKLSEAGKGRKHSPETIAKRKGSLTGQKRSPEAVERNRQAQLQRYRQKAA